MIGDAAFSRGDLMRRMAQLEDRLRHLETARRLEGSTIGRGGINVRGGSIVILDPDGVETMRLSTTGLTLTGLLQVLGEIQVTGNSIVVFDPTGAEVFRAGSDGLTLSGLLEVIGGGDIRVTDGRLIAADGSGDVFRVDPSVPEIFMRPELIESVSAEVFAARIHNDNITNPTPEETASVTFTDLATVGPTVPGVDISPAGKALVILSAALVPAVNDSAIMSFEVTGASSVAPNNDNILALLRGADLVVATTSTVIPVTGLNPGLHQFQAKYRSEFGAPAGFSNRGLTVMAF